MELTFDCLRRANLKRLPLFKNGKGEPAHSKPDGSDWKLSQWSNAIAGEGGEMVAALEIFKRVGVLANCTKKIDRGDKTIDEAKDDLANELADIVCYVDILASRAGINLGDATINKFNEVSDRVKCDVYL